MDNSQNTSMRNGSSVPSPENIVNAETFLGHDMTPQTNTTPITPPTVSPIPSPYVNPNEPHSTANRDQAVMWEQPMPLSVENMEYMNTFLRTQVGRRVTVEFLIGSSSIVVKTGLLVYVGANYIILNEIETDDALVCDFYNIKFVTVYY